MSLFTAILAIVLSYLLGAVPFGYVVARLRGVDIFAAGSGNIGATNVGRVLGRKLGVLVFVLDFLKGAVPTAVTRYLLPEVPWAAVAAGLAAFVGHMFPVYLRFRGGKGVATGTGVVAVLLPGPTAAAALVWLAALASARYVSLASVLAAITLAAFRLLTPEPFAGDQRTLTVFALFAAVLIIVRHRSNLIRLAGGTENRVTDSPRLRMLARVLHVLALAIWFGTAVFFLVATLTIFHTFERLADQRPAWLAVSGPLTKDDAIRLAGVAVGPLFPRYFAMQGVCGLVALITAWGWTRSYPERIHRVRFAVLAGAVVLVLLGWPLVEKIEGLRFERYFAPDENVRAAARAAFNQWHAVSLLLNFGVLVLAGVATALAARLPADPPPAKPLAA